MKKCVKKVVKKIDVTWKVGVALKGPHEKERRNMERRGWTARLELGLEEVHEEACEEVGATWKVGVVLNGTHRKEICNMEGKGGCVGLKVGLEEVYVP
jgi:hypothetical protein